MTVAQDPWPAGRGVSVKVCRWFSRDGEQEVQKCSSLFYPGFNWSLQFPWCKEFRVNHCSQAKYHVLSTQLMSPHDVAVYGGLCALATYDRKDLHDKVLASRWYIYIYNYRLLSPFLLYKECYFWDNQIRKWRVIIGGYHE